MVNADLQETVNAARTIESLRLGPRRITQTDDDIREWIAWERRTLRLRTAFFGSCEVAYVVPLVLCLLFGGFLVMNGQLTIGAVAAAALVHAATRVAGRHAARVAGRGAARVCLAVTRGRRF